MSRSAAMYLDDMVEAARFVLEFSRGLDREGFLVDRKTRDATLRNLEVLGEAAKRLPESIRSLDSNIPWRRITAMRDVLAHAYFGIDDAILWNVVSEEIPLLLPRLLSIQTGLAVDRG